MSGEIWFTSDTHFGHAGALGLFKRRHGSVSEMDESLIAGWNALVGPSDIVWHLGDFGYRLTAARTRDLLRALNGRKRLVIGNNDGEATLTAPQWEDVSHYAEIEVAGTFLVLCHYPFKSWNRMHKGAWNLHGHSHGRLPPAARQVDVGVDVWSFRPVRFDEILSRRAPSGRTREASCAPPRQ